MTDDTIFSDVTTDERQGVSQAQEIPNEVSDLVGEGKKYADVPTALKALAAAQSHIQTIEGENKELKLKVQESKTVEDIFDVVNNQSNKPDQDSTTTIPDTVELVNEVVNVIDERDAKKIAANNIKAASDKLVELYGDEVKAKEMLDKKALEFGVSVDFLMASAAKSPKAFIQYFSTSSSGVESGNAGSEGINTQGLSTSISVKEGTKEWWSAQRKEKGDTWYFNQANTSRRSKDAIRLGRDAFFGRTK